jgi:hypothetical protein
LPEPEDEVHSDVAFQDVAGFLVMILFAVAESDNFLGQLGLGTFTGIGWTGGALLYNLYLEVVGRVPG